MPASPEGDIATGIFKAQRVVESKELDQIHQSTEPHLRLQSSAEIAQTSRPRKDFEHGLQRSLLLPLQVDLAFQMGMARITSHQQLWRGQLNALLLSMQHEAYILYPGALLQQGTHPEIEALQVELPQQQFRRNPGRVRPVPATRFILIEMQCHSL